MSVAPPSIYRSPEGQAELLRLYDLGLERLGVPTSSLMVATSFGTTHVLVAGPDDAPPLLVFQGGNFLNPLSLAWFKPLMTQYRVYAPDAVGHPGRSAQTRLSVRDNSYGNWVVELLDGLGLERVPMLGPSFGAGIILRAAAVAPQRISGAILLVPSGLVSPPAWPLLSRIVWPMLRYRMRPSREHLEQAVQPMFTGEVDELWLKVTGAVFQHLKIEKEMPRNAKQAELADFHAPTMVIAGARDVFFPGAEVLSRARRMIPNLVHTELLPSSGHVPLPETLEAINLRISEFLALERA